MTIAIAKDAPEMSATIPTGLCESQPSPYQNATAKQTSNEETNRPQNAPPIVLTFSLMAPPIDLATLVSQPRILFPLYLCLYHQGIDLTLGWYGLAHDVSSTSGGTKATRGNWVVLICGSSCIKNPSKNRTFSATPVGRLGGCRYLIIRWPAGIPAPLSGRAAGCGPAGRPPTAGAPASPAAPPRRSGRACRA